MIYVCVPVHNEAKTAGLVLWKVRQVFSAFPREYQLLVLDDASTDGTAELLASYAKVLPMTTITHRQRQGYARSLEELLRLALQRTDRPKRDCAITLHADFVHSPEAMEEMVKRLESGADLVVAELLEDRGGSRALRLARRWAPRLLRLPGLHDTISGFVALRLIVLRQALRAEQSAASGAPPAPLLTTDGWCANAELLARLVPHARRLDPISAAARYDLVQRPSRVRPLRELLAAWRARPVIRAARHAGAALLLCAFGLRAQSDSTDRIRVSDSTAAAARPAPAVPFPVGERFTYSAKYGPFNVGEATLQVAGIDTLRGTETVHLLFEITGGALWYSLHQTLESWVGRGDFRTRRFVNRTEEKGRSWQREFDVFPDSGFYREAGADTTAPTVEEPLDDAAFLYWIRTVPLERGKHYEFRRYFRPEKNPVIVEVLGRDRVGVAGRKWDAIVIRPKIPNAGGILGEKQDTRIWLSVEQPRIMLGMQSKFSFGQVTLKLKEYSLPERP